MLHYVTNVTIAQNWRQAKGVRARVREGERERRKHTNKQAEWERRKDDLGELLTDFNGGEMEAEMASVAAAAVGKSEGNPSALSTAMPFSL